MTGYELFKRFSFEQLTGTILRLRKITVNIVLGILVSLVLVTGSFYLSLNGAHRLIDTKDAVLTTVDSSITKPRVLILGVLLSSSNSITFK